MPPTINTARPKNIAMLRREGETLAEPLFEHDSHLPTGSSLALPNPHVLLFANRAA
jgi:hypothetical protein